MGMFDSLLVECPKCRKDVEFQSKAGDCKLAEYNVLNCPPSIAGDLIGQSARCKCGHSITIRGAVVLVPEHCS